MVRFHSFDRYEAWTISYGLHHGLLDGRRSMRCIPPQVLNYVFRHTGSREKRLRSYSELPISAVTPLLKPPNSLLFDKWEESLTPHQHQHFLPSHFHSEAQILLEDSLLISAS